ncbi:unnamed protein product, partial [Sphagnum troendelagicum]
MFIRFAQHEVQPTIFGYAELKVATRDFHPTMKLGEGSFGVVYKGIFANGVEVAIKQLFVKTQKNIDEFLNEVVIISGVKHRNLVKLKGCCLRDNKRLLVYEYLENGDLANLLFGGQNNREVLFWPTRFNICLGIARGLHYLHDICQPRIIHRDIKASNILLDKKLQPKIADFGLAFLFPDDKSHISTMHVAGTRGYLAPEYATRGLLTTKVDVYSFGVLLLEIISGRKNIDHNLPLEDIYLVEKAWRLHREGNLIDIVDQNLHLLNDETIQAQRLLNITLLCLLNDGEKRPSMARVVAMLQGELRSNTQPFEPISLSSRSSRRYHQASTAPLSSSTTPIRNSSSGYTTSTVLQRVFAEFGDSYTLLDVYNISEKLELAHAHYEASTMRPPSRSRPQLPPAAPTRSTHSSSRTKAQNLPASSTVPQPKAKAPQPSTQALPTKDTSNNTRKVIIISTIVSGIVLALVIAITTRLFWRSRQRQRYLLLQLHERFAQHEVQPTIFGYAELKVATRDFHPTMKLGEGSFGVVYKGIFANGVEVAIKQLFVKTQENIDEFLNEVVIISGVKHRNLVKLKGCCLRDNKRLLVYEYLENGDLANLLFGGQNNREVLFWPTRFNICLGIARGLHYLHDICQPRIIHRDIKASNILLDKKLQPKIADFGLAFLFPDDKSYINTMHVAGTRGYLAPEYATRGLLTTKVDVYSFGVLLLEIISGRKNIDHNLPLENIYLVEKAWRLHREGNLIDIVDQNLHLLNDETIQAQRLLNITLLCLLNDGEKRPSMARVVAMLQGE